MSWFAALRANVWAFLAAAGAFLFGLLTYYRSKSKRATERAEQAEKTIQYREHVEEADTEIEQDFSRRAIEANKDIKNGEVPRNLSDPDSW